MIRSPLRHGMSTSQTLLIAAIITGATLAVFYQVQPPSGQDARRITIDRMMTFMDGLDNYAIDNGGMFPDTDQGLEALQTCPTTGPLPHNWKGPYVDEHLPMTDAWGMPIEYYSPSSQGENYAMESKGADSTGGGDGADADIESWDRDSLVP